MISVRTVEVSPASDVQLHTVPDAARILSLSRSVLYEEMKQGRLRWVKRGRSRLIPATAIAEYVALLEAETEAAPAC
ncbi:helix-turn-helix domain-containing protein [Actinomadura kijaniata]|uniref:helix-turn-helix domain-containing protein n=1 Tax=Actinomadura kijaniata TaxID=46161 RepID=UPI00082C1F5C|nr:helix-turn-helix domain-containing protein [Actinomadura kijaniata]